MEIYDHISRERMDFPIKETKTIGYSYGGKKIQNWTSTSQYTQKSIPTGLKM